MSSCSALAFCLAAVGLAGGANADRRQAALTSIPVESRQSLTESVGLSAADTCIVSPNKPIIYRIDGWVTGNELYK